MSMISWTIFALSWTFWSASSLRRSQPPVRLLRRQRRAAEREGGGEDEGDGSVHERAHGDPPRG